MRRTIRYVGLDVHKETQEANKKQEGECLLCGNRLR
jgi:hypothetical protein